MQRSPNIIELDKLLNFIATGLVPREARKNSHVNILVRVKWHLPQEQVATDDRDSDQKMFAILIDHTMSNELVHLRRKYALTQSELARLIGISQTSIARLETEESYIGKHLSLKTAFALQVVFGKAPGNLFADFFLEVEDAVLRKASELDRWLDGQSGPVVEQKRVLLSGIVRRADPKPAIT